MAEADLAPAAHVDQTRALAELRQLIGFHISLANTAIKSHFHAQYSGLRLTQKQIAILWLVDGCPGIIQVDLARHLGVKRATMSAMVGVLADRGLVARSERKGGDPRQVPLNLTASGRSLLREARRSIERHEAWVRQHFSLAEQQTIAVLMARLYALDD
jgi:DNA-binding MarR family transcriptional regulator